MGVTVKDNLPKFAQVVDEVFDSAITRMANDMIRIAQIKVPFDKGDLFKEIKHKRVNNLEHKIEVNSKYAAYHEKGMRKDGSHVVKNYSTPGTGAHFLRDAGNKVESDALNYFRQAGKAARL